MTAELVYRCRACNALFYRAPLERAPDVLGAQAGIDLIAAHACTDHDHEGWTGVADLIGSRPKPTPAWGTT